MIERQSADITIKDPTGTEIFTVPITSDCRRKKKLMEEDCITIKFDSTEAKPMPVGSYVDDEIFGRFFLTEEQLPSWDKGIGGYTYDLRFDAWYKLWALKKNMLTTVASGERKRKENSWTLTGNLETHLREVYHNLLCLDFVQKATKEVDTGGYKNIICPFAVQEDGEWSIKVYSKYAVAYDTIIEVSYLARWEEEDGGETYWDEETIYNTYYIPKGKHIGEWVDGEGYYEDNDNLRYNDQRTVNIYSYSLAQVVSRGSHTYVYYILKDGNTEIEYDFDDIPYNAERDNNSTYEDCTYVFCTDKKETLRSTSNEPEINNGYAYTDFSKMKSDMNASWLTEEEPAEISEDETEAKTTEKTLVVENVTESDLNFGTYFSISDTIVKRLNALTIDYNGTDILSALKKIADTFECEYWVDIEDNNYPYPTFKVSFGKCETGDEKTISCKDYQENGETKPFNAESIAVNKDQSNDAQKFFIYGSEDNLPYSYRKQLEAECVDTRVTENVYHVVTDRYAFFKVPHILLGYKGYIDPLWFAHEEAPAEVTFSIKAAQNQKFQTLDHGDDYWHAAWGNVGYKNLPRGAYSVEIDKTALQGINAHFFCSSYNSEEDWVRIEVGLINKSTGKMYPIARTKTSYSRFYSYEYKGTRYYSYDVINTQTSPLRLESGDYRLAIKAFFYTDGYVREIVFNEINVAENIDIAFKGVTIAKGITTITYEGNTYKVTTNPNNLPRPAYIKEEWRGGHLYGDIHYYKVQLPDNLNIQVGDKVVFNEDSSVDIPQQYFTTPYDNEASLLRLGGKRLMLPDNTEPDNGAYMDEEKNWVCLNNMIVPYDKRYDTDNKSLKETVVSFDKIYPNGKMKVKKVIAEDKETKTEISGETELYSWKWRQYHLQLETAAGQDFTFDKEYILDGYELGIRFLPYTDLTEEEQQTTPKTDKTNGSKLSGMQFSVEFNKKKAPFTPSGLIAGYGKIENPTGNPHIRGYYELINGEYVLSGDTEVRSGKTYYQYNAIPNEEGYVITDGEREYTSADLNQLFSVVRNKDFGALLPNDILLPKEGDACCLINWDVRAMRNLGLITAAEMELMEKGFEYANALKEGNTTFTCDMMSNFFFDWFGEHIPMYVKSQDGENDLEAYVRDSANTKDILAYVKNDYYIYRMPDIGQKVIIKHEGLHNGERSTRILGMELKLDKPYDTPRLICGETDVYSRLKQLEKEITKLTN